MFAKEDVKQLVESINVGTITEEEKNVLVEDVYAKLDAAFTEVRESTIAECNKTADEKLRKEKVKSYRHGIDTATKKADECVKGAETTAFAAGKEQGIRESEEGEEELSDEIVDKIEQFCMGVDKLLRLTEIATHEDSKEYFKESTKKAVSQFVTKTINESFPEKLVVNYDRLNQLEDLCESLKNTLTISDATVCEAKEKAVESVATELNEAKEVAQAQTKKRITAEQMLESVKAENHLLKKVAGLPLSEQKELLESFKGASIATINESFDKEYQKLLRKHGEVKPQVNDVISESVVAKNLREDAVKETAEDVNKNREVVNESTVEKPTVQPSMMDAYALACKHIRM